MMDLYKCSACGAEYEHDSSASGSTPSCSKCGTKASEIDIIIKPGTVIGGFEVGKLLGQGGMGNVYRGKQTSMRRDVALKILHKNLTEDKKFISQFLSEVRTTAQLRHRNIVTALDAGEDNGKYFLAMNFIDGESIEARIDKKRGFDEKEALEIAVKVADALNYVWGKLKIFHKDIKPGNIMLDKSGEAYLLDLGIAQFIGDVGHARKDRILGSPYYMSPEQTRGDPLDWHSDLYSLGATLYHMIVGVPPFDHKELTKILEMHTTTPFPPPETRNPDVKVSPAYVALIEKMMGKKPESRFDSWEDFITAAKKLIAASAEKPEKQEEGKGVDTPCHPENRWQANLQARKGVSARQTQNQFDFLLHCHWSRCHRLNRSALPRCAHRQKEL